MQNWNSTIFAQGEYLSVQVTSPSPGAATDLVVEIDLF
jgi:hypothetical protein